MKRSTFIAAAGLAALAACTPDQTPTSPGKISQIEPTLDANVPDEGAPGEPRVHADFVRGVTRAAHGKPGGGSSPNLVWHGGDVMTSATVTPIFWGQNWSNATFAGDRIAGIDAFYGAIGGSSYINTNTEYTATNGQVTTKVSSSAHLSDFGSSLRKAPKVSEILSKVCSLISNPVSNGYYPVYTDLPRGHAGYCAWHSAGNCGSTTVQFAFFFVLDGDSGCDPGASVAETGHSQGLSALGNVSGHELSEALTDPHLDAWYDNGGAENSDKCAWTFGATSVALKSNSKWKIQGNWSNAAYDANQGYTDVDGGGFKRGCIQTK